MAHSAIPKPHDPDVVYISHAVMAIQGLSCGAKLVHGVIITWCDDDRCFLNDAEIGERCGMSPLRARRAVDELRNKRIVLLSQQARNRSLVPVLEYLK